MGILDQIKSWTPDKADGRSDFDDDKAYVYRPRVARQMVRTIDATAVERSLEAQARNALRDNKSGNTDYENQKIDTRPFQDEVGQPSEPQRALIIKLVEELMGRDEALGRKAAEYTVSMTNRAAWTRGKTGNASAWIGRLITQNKALRTAPVAPAARVADYAGQPSFANAPAAPKFDKFDDVTDGNYAIVRAGKTHFYRITRKAGRGQYAGRTFLNIQERASEELFPVRGAWATRKSILDEIRTAGVEASHVLYANKLGHCWRCNLALTDDTGNPYRVYGLGPDCGPKVMG